MSDARPELWFVSGPQHDERVVLMHDVMIAGRDEQADIHVREPFVSRRQLRFALVSEGWIVESLSHSSPMRVNGKTYKPGKQVLLATGDVIALGAETELLYVDAQDDPNRVLAEYRRLHPSPSPQPVAPPEPAPASAAPEAPPPDPTHKPKAPALSTADKALRERKARLRKYAIAFVVYLALLAVGAIALSLLRSDKHAPAADRQPPRLTDEKIEEVLTSPLVLPPNEVSAERNLKEARGYFLRRSAEEPNLYLCVKAYRLYKAYRRSEQRVFEPEDERNFSTAGQELKRKVLDLYANAWVAENNARWLDSYRDWDRLLRYVPVDQARDDPPVSSVLMDNVLEHWSYVSRQLDRK